MTLDLIGQENIVKTASWQGSFSPFADSRDARPGRSTLPGIGGKVWVTKLGAISLRQNLGCLIQSPPCLISETSPRTRTTAASSRSCSTSLASAATPTWSPHLPGASVPIAPSPGAARPLSPTCAARPRAATVRALLESGADTSQMDETGLTALDYARRKLARLQARPTRHRKSPSLDENNQLRLSSDEQRELDSIREEAGNDAEYVRLWWQEHYGRHGESSTTQPRWKRS